MLYELPFVKKEETANNTFSFYFDISKSNFKFISGQHVGLSLRANIDSDPYGNTRLMSVASKPGDKHLEIATRIRDSQYKQALMSLKAGDLVDIEGPYGQFTLHEDKKRPAVFIAGGIGVAPVMSIIRQTKSSKPRPKITLLYCSKTPETAPYLDELVYWSRAKNSRLEVTMTQDCVEWSNMRGRFSEGFITGILSEHENPICYVVGLPNMVADVKNMLLSLGIPWDAIVAEDFAGY